MVVGLGDKNEVKCGVAFEKIDLNGQIQGAARSEARRR
jgi:hypothetical protein